MTIPVTLLRSLLANLSNPDATQEQIDAFVAYLGFSGPSGSDQIGFIQAGTGAVERTAQSKMREIVSIVDFGGSAGSGDNTAAMDRCEAELPNGGVIYIPYAGEWRMNWVCTTPNIKVMGSGGNAEFDENCIRPYDITKPVMTFGDGTTDIRYGGLMNCHVSGTDGTPAGTSQFAHNAPQAILVKGGIIDFRMDEFCYIYNGQQGISILPSTTQPVTVISISGGIRNDITDSTAARASIITRLVNPNGYVTALQFPDLKLNTPAGFQGFACELVGDGILLSVSGAVSYWDLTPGHGIFINGNSSIASDGLNLDPNAVGAVVVTLKDATIADPTRWLAGRIAQGGQAWVNNSGAGTTYTLADEANFYAYRATLSSPFVILPMNVGKSTDAQSTTQGIGNVGDSGPFNVFGWSWRVDKDLIIRGGNAFDGGTITAASGTGGLQIVASGSGADALIRVTPKGAGVTLFGAGGVQPAANNAQVNGAVGNAWSNVVSTKYSDAAGNQVVGVQQALVANGVNAAGAPTQAEFNALVTQFNALLARLRTHGLIAT